MKRTWLICLTVALACGSALSQAPPSGQKTLAATMNVYVFPTKGQAPDVQSQDEAACYSWAVQNTGTDPFDLSKQAQAEAQQTEQAKQQAAQVGQGAGARGAVRGAARGALIGEIVDDDAGKGAAYGAAAGMIRGRRRGRAARSQAQESAEQQGQQAQAATAEQLTNFKNAFSVCLEAKNYMVKF
ncbi:MAG: glycine zipper family protein [Acidobacteriota bacterium]|nr:glycine zipper family protein [Acidobacteriota bacterium]MDH3784420.1 glycine zipper family protein [Acidobacteriota bacterium]